VFNPSKSTKHQEPQTEESPLQHDCLGALSKPFALAPVQKHNLWPSPTTEGHAEPTKSFTSGKFVTNGMRCTIGRADNLPPNCPNARLFLPPAGSPDHPPCVKNHVPVLTPAGTYHSNDPSFAESLAGYTHRRDDNLGPTDDKPICCEATVSFASAVTCETLSACGDPEKTRVVFEWPARR
jgi:hypothetical protein